MKFWSPCKTCLRFTVFQKGPKVKNLGEQMNLSVKLWNLWFQRGQKHNTHDERKELLWFNGYFHAWRAIKLYYKAPFTSHLRLRRTISHTICQSSFRTKWFSEQPSTHLLRLSKISLCSAILFVLLFRGCVNFENNFSVKKSSWFPSNFYEK